jgi:hypothetical protein
VKGGFIVGGQFGDGALRVNGKTISYYRSVAASYGLMGGIGLQGSKITKITPSA